TEQPPPGRSHTQTRTRSDHPSFAANRRSHPLPRLRDGNKLQHPIREATGAFGELTIVASSAPPPDRAQGRDATVRVRHFASPIAVSWNGDEAGSRFAHATLPH